MALRLLVLAAAAASARAQAVPAGYLPLTCGGAPAQGTLLTGGAAQVYYMDVPTPFSMLHIVLAPQFGEVSLFVSLAAAAATNPPAQGTAQYSSALPIGVDTVDVAVTDAAVISACPRATRSGSTCRFYVAAQAINYASGFVLSATVDGRPKTLVAGVTVEDRGLPSVYNFYTFASTTSMLVSFSLTTFAGSPGLFVGCSLLGQTTPRGDTPQSYCKGDAPRADGSSTLVAAGSVPLSLRADGTCACLNGTLYVGVGSSDSSVTVFGLSVVDSSQLSVQLHDGLAVRSSVPMAAAGAAAVLFDFVFVPAAAVSTLNSVAVVTVSQFASNATGLGAYVYVKFVTAASDTPGAANFMFRTRIVAGAASVAVPSADANLLAVCGGPLSLSPCRMRIAIVSDPGSVFIVVARTNTGLHLTDGVTVVAEAVPGSLTYFRYAHTQVLSPVIITVTPLTGPLAIYLGTSKNPLTAPPGPGAGLSTRSVVPLSANIASTVLTFVINPTDADACFSPCTFYVSVAPQANADGVASFSVLVRTRDVTTVALMDGMPTTDVIAAYEYNFYAITMPQTAFSITLALVPLSGSARVLVAANGSVPGDVYSTSGAGYQYAGPLAQFVGTEAQLVISRNDAALQGLCRAAAAPPANGSGFGLAFTSTPCPLSISVASLGSGGAYTLVAYTRSRLLQDGVTTTVNNLQPGALVYFAFEAAAGATHVKLSLTPLIGTAEGYVSTTEPSPSSLTSFLYSLGGLQANTLTLDAANSMCDKSQSRCVYFIGVTPFSTSSGCSFRIQGTSMKVTYVGLDEPVPGHAGPSVNGLTYYTFVVPTTALLGFDVLIEPSTGGWIMAAAGSDFNAATGTVFPPTINCAAAPPAGAAPYTASTCPAASISFTHASFWTLGGSSRTRLSLVPGPGYTPGAAYAVGLASPYESDFVMTLRPAGDATTLLNGVLMHDSFQAGGSQYAYKVTVPTQPAMSLLTFQAIPTAGDIVLYLGVNVQPTATNYSGRATMSEGYRFTLSPAQLAAACASSAAAGLAPNPPGDGSTCAVYVVVQPDPRATFPTNYAIVALVDGDGSDPIRLTPGVPQLGAVAFGKYAYYFAPISVPAQTSYYVSLVMQSSGGASVYVNLQKDQSTQTWTFPQSSSYQLTSAGFISPTIVTIAPRGLSAPFYSNQTTVLISVLGTLGDFTTFYVTLGTSQNVIELPDGNAVEGAADAGTSAYYSFSVGNVPADLNLAVTTLSGQAAVYAMVWYTPATVGVNQNLRPQRGSSTWSSNFEGTLLIPRFPTDPNSCAGACTYIFAVFCSSSITCQFQLTASSSSAVLTRLTASVPAMGLVAQGAYKYYVFDAGYGLKNLSFVVQEYSGIAQIFATDTFQPGISTANLLPQALPACPAGNCMQLPNYKFASPPGPPTFLQISQNDLPAAAPGSGAVTRSDHLYVLGVFALVGPLSFSLVGRQQGATVVLTPGGASVNNMQAFQQVDYFSFDNLDMFHDLVITVELMYGDVEVAVSTRGNAMTCTVQGPEGNAVSTCAGAVWKVASNNTGQATLRVAWQYPCGNQLIVVDSCDPLLDWQPGPITIAVVNVQSTIYTITADTGASPVRLIDGQPTEISQTSDGNTQIFAFSCLPDVAGSDVRFELGSHDNSAPFSWYLNSCIDFMCSVADQSPGAAPLTSKMSGGLVPQGYRAEIVVSKTTPGYCLGVPSRGDICDYYLVVVPDANSCANLGIFPCSALLDITAISLAGSAPLLVPFEQISGRLETFVGLNRADKLSYYRFFINEPTAPDSSTKDVVLRLDTCDTLLGQYSLPWAYACVLSATALGNPNNRTQCVNMRRPSVSDNNYVISPLALGYGVLTDLAEPSNELLVSVGARMIGGFPNASAAALAQYGPSNYELSIADGLAVRLRMPWPAACPSPSQPGMQGACVVAVQADYFGAVNLSWPAPVVTQYNAAGSFNVTAVGVRYNLYIAPVSFSAYATQLLNVSVANLGIMPNTACGIERWQRLLAANITQLGTPAGVTALALTNYSLSVNYKVMVVAVCDEACIVLNYAQLGLAPPIGAAFSTQRLPYVQSYFVLQPAPVPAAVVDSMLSASFFGFLLFFGVAAFAGALFMAFSKTDASAGGSTVKHGTLETGGGTGGIRSRAPDGRVITVKAASHLFSARSLRSAEGHGDASAGKAVVGAGASEAAAAAAAAALGGSAGLDELARVGGRVSAAAASAAPSLAASAAAAAPVAIVVASSAAPASASASAPAPATAPAASSASAPAAAAALRPAAGGTADDPFALPPIVKAALPAAVAPPVAAPAPAPALKTMPAAPAAALPPSDDPFALM